VWDTYLKELSKHGTKIKELSFKYMKQSFAFVQLGSSCICFPMGPRSVVLVMELLYTAILDVYFLPCNMLVDNKYSRNI
jgi:hypothetical protein